MAPKQKAYYAVAKGRNAAIYSDWDSCKEQVNGYSGSRYKKFSSKSEAESFIQREGTSSNAVSQRSSHQFSPSDSFASSNSSYDWYGSSNRLRISANANSYRERTTGSDLNQYSHGDSSLYSGYSSSARSGELRKLSKGTTEKIFVDGACRGNGKMNLPSSGYGVYYGPNSNKNVAASLADVDDVYQNKPSNQRAELFGVKHALHDILKAVSDPKSDVKSFEIHTDSQYAKNCVETWSKNWEENDWKTAEGKPAKNVDIIKDAYGMYKKLNEQHPSTVSFVHVKGHLGNEGNESADRLANQGADKMASQLSKS